MLLLVEKFAKFYSKLENHHHHEEDGEALSASLHAFRSKVSNSLNQLLFNPEPRSESLSFSWIRRSLELVPIIDKAFAKLVVEIEHPTSKWEAGLIDEYFSYSLYILDFLNLISSSISHLGQARISLSHALSKKKIEALTPVTPKISIEDFRKGEKKAEFDAKRFRSRKEMVIHQALVEIKSIGFWVCGVILSGLYGDARPYTEIKKLASGFSGTLLTGMDSRVLDGGVMLKEVKEVNDAVASIVAVTVNGKLGDEAGEELKRRLEELEKVMEELGTMVDQLFSRTLAGRNQLLDTLRLA